MYNSKRTLEVFGYDLESTKRRSKIDVIAMGGRKPKDMPVVDNCPSCNEERQVNLNQSRKNKPCSKCFHNTPEMIQAKQNQSKVKSEETKQKMKDSHWSKNGGVSAFKGKKHTKKTKKLLANKSMLQAKSLKQEIGEYEYKVRMGLMKRNINRDQFDGFISPINTLIRQSPQGKAWTYDVLAKANFTCLKCNERGGKLNAHHKNGFNLFPEQRFDLANGVCLCESCHESFHEVYGNGDNTKEQFNEWICSKAI